VRLFADNERRERDVNFPISHGMEPLRIFPHRYKMLRLFIKPILDGILPVRLLSHKLSSVILGRLSMPDGTVP
jgi:hypothetical protein